MFLMALSTRTVFVLVCSAWYHISVYRIVEYTAATQKFVVDSNIRFVCKHTFDGFVFERCSGDEFMVRRIKWAWTAKIATLLEFFNEIFALLLFYRNSLVNASRNDSQFSNGKQMVGIQSHQLKSHAAFLTYIGFI